MPTIAELNQRHPSCDIERMRDLEALYEGDELFEKRLNRFLPAWEREDLTRYQLRKDTAFYRNYLGAIIDYFAAMLFTSKPKVVARDEKTKEVKPDPGDFYNAFRENCDRTGGDLDAFFKGRLTDAMVHKCSWFSVEQPIDKSGLPPVDNRADFEKRKLGDCWLRALSYDEVLDWENDEAGQLAWVVVYGRAARRSGIGVGRSLITDTWEHYLPDRIDTYAITYAKDQPPPNETSVPLVGERKHSFGRVPVIAMDLPRGLWAASRLKTPQLAHFRSSNAQNWSLATSCYSMMVFNVGDPEAFKAGSVGPTRGHILGVDEKASWMAPPSAHFDALDANIAAQKDEIFRLAHQMALGVENNAAAIGRTAESKSEDAQSTRVILLAYARIVKEAIERIYDLLEDLRGDEFEWSVEGLDDFASADLLGLVNVLEQVKAFGSIPSRTFNVQMFKRLAEGLLPDMDQATKVKIESEIEDNTPDPADEPTEEEKMHALALELSKNANAGGAGGRGGTKPPPVASGGSGGTGAASKPS